MDETDMADLQVLASGWAGGHDSWCPWARMPPSGVCRCTFSLRRDDIRSVLDALVADAGQAKVAQLYEAATGAPTVHRRVDLDALEAAYWEAGDVRAAQVFSLIAKLRAVERRADAADASVSRLTLQVFEAHRDAKAREVALRRAGLPDAAFVRAVDAGEAP